tara:strand:+ start:1681 stop:2598 length:918 start_codon:yes stop_codon:yes gene_type:complete
MSNLELFKGNALVNSELFQSLMDMNKKMAGGSGAAGKRISIRGGKFRMMVDGEQVSVSKSDTMNMVVLNAADISRTYYEGAFDPENPSAPTCWSADTRAPAADVPEDQRKAARCADCPMNVKGSGQGESRACRFSQRLAVSLENDLDTVYQLQLPATSIFGEAKGNDMGLQSYIKFLSAHKTPAIAVMTEMRFDEESATPKMYFRPVRGLEEDELGLVLEARASEDAQKAIAFTVAQTDGVKSKAVAKTEPKAEEKPKARAKPVEVDDVIDEGDEPTKVSKAKPAPKVEPKSADKLASIVDGWDD